ncbi:lipocalin family protein [Myroides odoratimimus]|uniref:lipocalin family protein n=1 Tax=Myroides odoratimimus TaxID=76832 RepID=UPI0038D3F982
MKKIFLFTVMTVMGVSTMACSSDDNSSTPDYKSSIQGIWVDSKTVYLDKDRKVLGEELADNNDGCGFGEREFKGDVATFKYPYRYIVGSINECRNDEGTDKYEIKGNKIIIESKDGDEIDVEEVEIVELTSKKLVILDLEKVTESGAEGEGWPKGTVYIQSEYVKK